MQGMTSFIVDSTSARNKGLENMLINVNGEISGIVSIMVGKTIQG
jgi:hypothetical protein